MDKKKNLKKKGKGSKPQLSTLIKPYMRMIVLLVFLALIGNGVNLVIPKIISHGIDSFSNGAYKFRTIAIEFLSATLVIFVFTYLQSVVQTYTSEKVARDLREKLSEKISRQSYAYIQKANPSTLLTNLTSDVDAVKLFVSQAVASIASSLFIIIGTTILLLTINWRLALTVIAIIPIIGGTFYAVLKRVRVLFKRSREIIDWLNKVINESILGAAIIRVMNSQQTEFQKFLSANTEAKNIGISILTLFATLIPIITFVANLATLSVLALGGHFVINGSMTLGEFAAFNSYISILIFPIITIGFMSNVIARSSASYVRIDGVLKAKEPVVSGTIDKFLQGKIELNNINLVYGEKPVLKNVSFTIPPNSRTAIIGPTAAGKSQLLYLLTGLIRQNSGTIQFDGKNIEAFKKDTFHREIGIVFQESVMFNLSLRENIAFNNHVTDKSIEKAIETAELKDFVDSLPDKLDTIVSERGTSLSGGQKQRIMLARALALHPKILLLDDFTARVDFQTEQKILTNVMKNYHDITLVTITQKIASVKKFDQIILLMEGEVIATGKHKDLLENCPEYIQIYNSQRSTSSYELQS
ncbi:MAG TPA: ABC transporter ATP-binding protein [Balneolales bacterium]|nr:ABC transporter ATP-binding protein [Balneolales bacterium]